MKTIFRILGAGASLALFAPHLAHAQTEPLIGAEITSIAVLSGTGSVVSVAVTAGGSGYTSAPAVTVSGGGGTGATLTAVLTGGSVTGLNIITAGTGYTGVPTITVAAPGTTATGTATVTGNVITAIVVGSGGTGYSVAPAITITGGGGGGATATATVTDGVVTSIAFTPGSGYTTAPTITIAPPGTTAAGIVRNRGTLFSKPFQNESFGPVGTPINITASAFGMFPVGGFTYTFYVNGVVLGFSVNSQPSGGGPGIIGWAPVQPGAYLLTVVASDGAHTVTTLPIRYFATGTAFSSPNDNTLVPNGSSVVLQATAMPGAHELRMAKRPVR